MDREHSPFSKGKQLGPRGLKDVSSMCSVLHLSSRGHRDRGHEDQVNVDESDSKQKVPAPERMGQQYCAQPPTSRWGGGGDSENHVTVAPLQRLTLRIQDPDLTQAHSRTLSRSPCWKKKGRGSQSNKYLHVTRGARQLPASAWKSRMLRTKTCALVLGPQSLGTPPALQHLPGPLREFLSRSYKS